MMMVMTKRADEMDEVDAHTWVLVVDKIGPIIHGREDDAKERGSCVLNN